VKKFTVAFLFLFLLALPCSASTWQGLQVDDGNTWNQMQEPERIPYLSGMIEGLKFRNNAMGPWEAVTEDLSLYLESLNEYYSEPDNLDIPMILMLDVVNNDIGELWESPDERDFRIESLREYLNSK
jgi:hypothetical protein